MKFKDLKIGDRFRFLYMISHFIKVDEEGYKTITPNGLELGEYKSYRGNYYVFLLEGFSQI